MKNLQNQHFNTYMISVTFSSINVRISPQLFIYIGTK